MYNFIIQCYSNYRGLFLWLNWPGYISGVLLQPFASVIMFSILGRFASSTNQAQAYALGISVFSMAFVAMNGIAQSYSYDRAFGTISFVFVSSASRLINFLSRSVLHYPNALISFGCGLAAGYWVLDMSFSAVNWAALIVAVVVLAASISAAGQLLGILSIAFRNWIAFQSMALGILLVFTGVIIPVQRMPEPVMLLSGFLPITNGLEAVKMAYSGASITMTINLIIKEFIVFVVYLAISFIGFSFFERIVKRSGTLEQDSL